MDLLHRKYTERALVKTKIIATVGPACESREALRDLVLAGVDLFRLNFAHGTHDWLLNALELIRDISVELQRPIAVLGDLAGPKIRLGVLQQDEVRCADRETVRFVRDPDPKDPRAFTSTYEHLIDDLNVDDRLLLADGTVGVRVVEKAADGSEVKCIVEQAGVLRSRQGINLPGVKLSAPSLTEKDLTDLDWAVKHGLDFIGLSFVRSPDDIRDLREAIQKRSPNSHAQIVAKIEKLEAVDRLESILEQTDAVMVARGDLGVEVDIARVPPLQKQIIRMCNRHRIPVITATQMLDSMTRQELPTRAEASDVANAVLDGSDAVMLSGETAIGNHPSKAVAMMSRIAHQAERLVQSSRMPDIDSRADTRAKLVTEAVTQGASVAAEHLKADILVVATHSGRTAMAVSKQRSSVPVLALTDRPETARRMCLYWGVTALETDAVHDAPRELVKFVVDWGKKLDVLASGSRLVIVGSTEWSTDGHDLMLVHVVR